MPSVRRVRELLSTLRFRLVLWITLIVFVLVMIKNVAIRAIEQRILQWQYDQFLMDSLEEVRDVVAKADPDDPTPLFAALDAKVKVYEYRSWFLQVFDEKNQVLWRSGNAPFLPPPTSIPDDLTPYDNRNHRILERYVRTSAGKQYALRGGFLQMALQDDVNLLNRYLMLASISILVVTPLGGYLIALRATRPITQIIEATAQLQPTNLNERLPIRGTGDEIDQLSQTINGMLDRLASFIEQNRDFVANAAHELRSPLTAIRSSVEVGLDRARTPDEYAGILADVMEEIGRLADLVNRLLILAESDAGRLGVKDQRTQLDKIVRESVDMFDAVADLRGVRLTIGELAPAWVPGDETYLRQVVRNLIDNAIKYNTNPGEVKVCLHVDAASKQAILTVKDTGIGIDPEVLPRVFERFYRADRARTRESQRAGSGLGLSICQAIVQALHGTIRAESTAGLGTTFTVQFPLLEEAGSHAQPSDKPTRVPAGWN